MPLIAPLSGPVTRAGVWIMAICLFAAGALVAAEPNTRGWGQIEIMPTGNAVPLTLGPAGPGAKVGPLEWGPENARNQGVSVVFGLDSATWTNLEFSFTPEKTGGIRLNLIGPYIKEGDKLKRVEMLVDGLSATGCHIANGNFEEPGELGPKSWGWSGKDNVKENLPLYLAKSGLGGSRCVMTWRDGSASQLIAVEKGRLVTVKFSVRLANGDDKRAEVVAPMTSAPKKMVSAGPLFPDVPLGLSSIANLGFADEAPGDGKGGWSDQGSENDFASFDTSRTNFQGVLFQIVNPAANGGRAVATFKSDHLHPSLNMNSAVLTAKGAKGRYLYLLHTTCWAPAKGRVGRITITLEDGRKILGDVNVGRDVADWWGAGHLTNGLVVVRKPNRSASVGIYLSRFWIDDEPAAVKEIEFRTEGQAIWIVVGATLSCQTVPFTPANYVAKASPLWRPVLFSNMVVAPGSALDFSGLLSAEPAGLKGRLIADARGELVFEKEPTKPIRFNAFNVNPTSFFSQRFWSYFETPLIGETEEKTRANIEAYVTQVRRQGYNMLRLQGVEMLLQRNDSVEEIAYHPTNLDRFDYLVYSCKKQGVYLNMDLAAYKVWMKGAWNEGDRHMLKERFLVDPASRGIWERGVRLFLSRKNPYTGMSLAADPVLAMVTFFNEQDIPIEQKTFEAELLNPYATARWRSFLKSKYQSAETLWRAWGQGATAANPFETEVFSRNLFKEKGERPNDAGIFLYELEKEMVQWYQKTIQGMGYTGLSGQFDAIFFFRNHAVHNESPLVFMHMYHNHPSAYTQPGSRMSQNGTILTAANYWRIASASRYLNRPMVITEYGTGFWCKARHEEGLLYPAYSAFQGFSGITIHTQPVISTQAYPLMDFMVGRDPVLRAGQALAALLYLRGDVAPSRHTTALALSKDYLFTEGHMNQMMAGEQSKLSLLSRFGLTWEGALPPGFPPYPAADLKIAPSSGGTLIIGDNAASVVESSAPKGLDAVVELMKAKGILSPDNITAGSKGLFQSDTRELTLNTADESLLVRTARTEGAVLKTGKGALLGSLEIKKTSLPAAIAASALDGKNLADSKRILLVFSTDALNTDFEASEDRVTLVKQGVLPVLLETGLLEMSLRNSGIGPFTLEALGLDGLPAVTLPVSVNNGAVQIRIDTSALKCGPTPFFLLTTP